MIIDKDEREKPLWLLYEATDPFLGMACLFTALKYSARRALGKPLAYKERQTTTTDALRRHPYSPPVKKQTSGSCSDRAHKRQVPCAKRIATNLAVIMHARHFCVCARSSFRIMHNSPGMRYPSSSRASFFILDSGVRGLELEQQASKTYP